MIAFLACYSASPIQRSISSSVISLLSSISLTIVYNYIFLQMEGKTLNLKHYVSVVTQLTFRAAAIAKECAQNPNLKKYEKSVNDPVTEADYKIQTMLCTGIRHFFPGLMIVGEETTEYKGHIELDLNAITLDNYPKDVELSDNIPIEEFVVWIDPIDNTRGFIKGTLDAVTILIGLSRKERAFLGILGLPYLLKDKQIVYQPEILVGTVEGKKAYTTSAPHSWIQLQAPNKNNPLRFLISDSRGLNPAVESLVKKYNATLFRIGGSGKKIAEVIFGHMDALLYLSAANHKWDSCAGEAIILALGGYFTDCYNNPILYDPKASTVNKLGNICGFGGDFYAQLIADIAAVSPNL